MIRLSLPLLVLSFACRDTGLDGPSKQDTSDPPVTDTSDTTPPEETGTTPPETGTTDTGGPPPPGAIEVRVFAPGPNPGPGVPEVPVPGADVSWADATGGFLGRATTNASGRVFLDQVPDGGSVSVVHPPVQSTYSSGYYTYTYAAIETVMGVKAGDRLIFGNAPPAARSAGGALTFDLDANKDGGAYATVAVDCRADSLDLKFLPRKATQIVLGTQCAAGPVGVLAVNYPDASYSQAVGFIDGTANLSGAPLAGTVALTGWSDEHGRVSVDFSDGAGIFRSRVFGIFGEHEALLAVSPLGSSVEANVSPAFGSVVVAATYAEAGALRERHEAITTLPAPGATTDVQLTAASFLPELEVPSADVRTQRPTVTIAGVGATDMCGTAAPVAVTGSFFVSRGNYGTGGYLSNEADWTFIAPVGGATFTMPELDPALGDLWPTTNFLRTFDASVSVVAADQLDYDDLRTRTDVTRASHGARPVDVAGTVCIARGEIVQ